MPAVLVRAMETLPGTGGFFLRLPILGEVHYSNISIEVYRCSSLGSVKLGPVIGGIQLTTQARLQEKVQRLGAIVGLLCRFGSLAGNVIDSHQLD